VADYETSSVNFFFKRYLPQMVLPAIVVSTVYFAIKWNAVSYVQLGSREFYSPSLLLYSTYGFVESPTTFLVMIIPISITVIATGIVILTTKKNQALYK
jgi:hypothetical protein